MNELRDRCVASIIIPCYNAEKYVAKAIESVLEQGQGVGAYEILAVNDGSSDQTSKILESFSGHSGFRILTHPGGANRGVCASRRLAMNEARGEFLAFLDSDDAFLPGKLARHVAFLQAHPEVVLIHGPIQFEPSEPGMDFGWNCNIGENPETYDLTRRPAFLRRNFIANSTVVCRREAVVLDDLPETMIGQAEDWVLWNGLAMRGKFHYDPLPLSFVLLHPQSYSASLKRVGAAQLREIEFYLCVLTRLPRFLMRLRATVGLVYNLFVLAKLRAAPNRRQGFMERMLQWFFDRLKRT